MLVHAFSRTLKTSLSLPQNPHTKQRIARVAEQINIARVHVEVPNTFPKSGDNSSLDGAHALKANFEFTLGRHQEAKDSSSSYHVNPCPG